GGKIMRAGVCRFALLMGTSFTSLIYAQGFLAPRSIFSELAKEPGGFHLGSISLNTSTYSGSLSNVYGFGGSGSQDLGVAVGIAGSVGWQHSTERTNFGFNYSASYYDQVVRSHGSALNHTMNFSANRRLGQKWNIGMSLGASLASWDQYM